MPLVTVSVRYLGWAIHERFERIQAQLSELSAIAQEALSGVRVVRAYRQEAVELSRFREANEEYVNRSGEQGRERKCIQVIDSNKRSMTQEGGGL